MDEPSQREAEWWNEHADRILRIVAEYSPSVESWPYFVIPKSVVVELIDEGLVRCVQIPGRQNAWCYSLADE